MDINSSTIEFFKLHGSGNDFVVIDNRSLQLIPQLMPLWAQKICARAFGVGADGLIFLDHPTEGHPNVDYIWHFFNADGSRPRMCGNGSRCAAFLAHRLGMAKAVHTFGTDAGPIRAEVFPKTNLVKVQLTPLQGMQTHISLPLSTGQPLEAHFVDTGVPHAVILTEDVNTLDVARLGKELRFHPHFAPAGANINFVQVLDKKHLILRTYERGVEAETYACGTGAAASAVVVHSLGRADSDVAVTTSGGDRLDIFLRGETVYLQGNATLVFTGKLELQALGLASSPE